MEPSRRQPVSRVRVDANKLDHDRSPPGVPSNADGDQPSVGWCINESSRPRGHDHSHFSNSRLRILLLGLLLFVAASVEELKAFDVTSEFQNVAAGSNPALIFTDAGLSTPAAVNGGQFSIAGGGFSKFFLNAQDFEIPTTNKRGRDIFSETTFQALFTPATGGPVVEISVDMVPASNPNVFSAGFVTPSAGSITLQAKLCTGVGIGVSLFASEREINLHRLDDNVTVPLVFDVVVSNLPGDVCNASDVFVTLSLPGYGVARVTLHELATLAQGGIERVVGTGSKDPLNPTPVVVSSSNFSGNELFRGESFRFLDVRYKSATNAGLYAVAKSNPAIPNFEFSQLLPLGGATARIEVTGTGRGLGIEVSSVPLNKVVSIDTRQINQVAVPPGVIFDSALPELVSDPGIPGSGVPIDDYSPLNLFLPQPSLVDRLNPNCANNVFEFAAKAWINGTVSDVHGLGGSEQELRIPVVVPNRISLEVECLDSPPGMIGHPVTIRVNVGNVGVGPIHNVSIEEGGSKLEFFGEFET